MLSRVRIRVRIRIIFSFWLVGCYVKVFILFSVVIVRKTYSIVRGYYVWTNDLYQYFLNC